MTKSEFVQRISSKRKELGDKNVRKSIDTILESITVAMIEQQRVEIRGFGSFYPKYHAARRSRNPQSGEVFQSPEKIVMRFRPAKELRERIDKNRHNSTIQD